MIIVVAHNIIITAFTYTVFLSKQARDSAHSLPPMITYGAGAK